MGEKQLPVHYKSADDLSNSVQITLAKGVIKAGSDKAVGLAAPTSIAISGDEIYSVSNLGLKLADGTKVAFSLSFFNGDAAQNVAPMRGAEPGRRDSKLGTWLLVSAVICVTTLCTICNPKWAPSSVAQSARISKQHSAGIKRRASTSLGGTAVRDTAKAGAGTVADAANIRGAATGRNPASDVQPKGETAHGSSSGAHRTLASDRDETGTRENSRGHSQSKKGLMVPPPPPTPYELPPEFDFFLKQPAQQHAASQQQLQQAQAQASSKTDNEAAAQENTPEESDQELQAADEKLQAAVRSSQRTVGEWTR